MKIIAVLFAAGFLVLLAAAAVLMSWASFFRGNEESAVLYLASVPLFLLYAILITVAGRRDK